MQIPASMTSFYAEQARDASNTRSARNRLADQAAQNAEVALETRVITIREKNAAENVAMVVDGVDKVSSPFDRLLPGGGEQVGQARQAIGQWAGSLVESASSRDAAQAASVAKLEAGRDQVAAVSPAEELAAVISQVA